MVPLILLLLTPQVEHQHHPPRDAAEYAKILEDPARDAWQKPHEVIMALKLRPDEVVADLEQDRDISHGGSPTTRSLCTRSMSTGDYWG